MSSRSRMGRRGQRSNRRTASKLFAQSGQRKRKTFTFERLEDRFAFSVVPAGMQVTNYSSDTPEGALAIWQSELDWAAHVQAQLNSAPITATTFSLPNDPLFANQWHLFNTGQVVGQSGLLQSLYGVAGEDINVVPVWNQGITGAGVKVGVVDTGVQLFQPDLVSNISPTLRLNALNGTNNVAPDFLDPAGFHGTAVAGIIAASWNNGIGGTGVAPNATIVPIKLIAAGQTEQSIFNTFQWAMQNGLDITNNSWGPVGNGGFGREAIPISPNILTVLRNAATQGRGGLGMINVFASGNSAGPIFTNEFGILGNYDSSSYNPFVNSRYTIGVAGVDHDGLYINADGTFTTYPVAGPSVLVSAPTGSNGAISIGDDDGLGSGIWTTDLVGDFGRNAAPLPNGVDPDNDNLADPDYTSRFNGTSASSPMVSGVIALMLQANPNLTYRDVQEILVRSARQNAQFESPGSGGLTGPYASKNTWQVNQIEPFRNPDGFFTPAFTDPFTALLNPTADVNKDGFAFADIFYSPDTNDGARQVSSHYEPQPPVFTNGAGYTVSQGYGVYREQIGYGHGVIDADLAVRMAQQWSTLGQNISPGTERTFTTSIINQGPNTGWAINSGAKGSAPPNGISFIVPGGIASAVGYIGYWNEYFQDDPFNNYTGPSAEARGESYIDFSVPPSQGIDVEWVEVRLQLDGPAADLDSVRIFLTSPNGTQSELNNFYGDLSLFTGTFSVQPASAPQAYIDPIGNINNAGDSFSWTFSSNRHWGESTNSEVIIHPVTGEPLLQNSIVFDPISGQIITSTQPVFRNWELHIENYSNSGYSLPILEVIWHGKPIAGGSYDPNYGVNGIQSAQRVQGFVGIDTNSDENFNYNRYVQTLVGSHSDVDTIRDSDVIRQLDFNDNNLNGVYDEGDTINQEPFAANVVVQAYRVFGGVAETSPIAQFLTGDDGNYYFDLNVQGDTAYAAGLGKTLEYEFRVIDPEGRELLEDVLTPALTTSDPQFTYLPHYKQVWRVNADWFFAPDRDNPLLLGNNPGEIFFDPATNAPTPYTNFGALQRIPMAIKNINFLLKQDAPIEQFDVEGTVYADLNGNGKFDGDDTPIGGVFVYFDVNRNGVHDAGEQMVATSDDPDPTQRGKYILTIPADHLDTYQVGVIPPTADWLFTDPGHDGVQQVFAGPGSPVQIVNFFFDPPDDAFPPNGANAPGNIAGVVFNDLNVNGVRNSGEVGLPGFRVFVDANENGAWDSGEAFAITSSNGSYFLNDIPPGLVRIDIEIANEGTENASWRLTSPTLGYRQVQLGPGGVVGGQLFGLENRANRDWGDLPDSYGTLAASGGPSHVIVPGFRLGAANDGEVNGIPSATANGDDLIGNDDDGIVILSNGGSLTIGPNVLQITVHGVGGLLNAWMDINGDGHFDASEQIFTNLDLNQGTHQRTISLPEGTVTGAIAARFRWGEPNLSWTGPSGIGEVEDYLFSSTIGAVIPLVGDYNSDHTVDDLDRIVWASTFGSTTDLRADGNQNGEIDAGDYIVWRKNVGASSASSTSVAAGSSSSESSGSTVVPTSLQQGTNASVTGGTLTGQSNLGTSQTVTPPAADNHDSATNDAAESRVEFVDVVTTRAARPGYRPVSGSVATAAVSDNSLLLVDHALADFDAHRADDADDDSLVQSVRGDQDENVCDLALAAVLIDRTNWWSGN